VEGGDSTGMTVSASDLDPSGLNTPNGKREFNPLGFGDRPTFGNAPC
jgi:hypothetical protein